MPDAACGASGKARTAQPQSAFCIIIPGANAAGNKSKIGLQGLCASGTSRSVGSTRTPVSERPDQFIAGGLGRRMDRRMGRIVLGDVPDGAVCW